MSKDPIASYFENAARVQALIHAGEDIGIGALENLNRKRTAKEVAEEQIAIRTCRMTITEYVAKAISTAEQVRVNHMPKTEPLYYTKGAVVFKRPIRRKTATGTNITVGFPVCTASEYVSASDIAAILNENERPVLDEPEDAVSIGQG